MAARLLRRLGLSPKRVTLGAIVKDEEAYIVEWLEHHLALGFDKVVVYDNGASAALPALLEPFGRRVALRAWTTRLGEAPQQPCYQHCLFRERFRSDWLMFLDIDEFLNLKVHDSVHAFTAAYERYDAVAVNWRMFGSSGAREPDGRRVTERFTWAAEPEFGPNAHVKTIFKPLSALAAGVHSPTLRPGARLVNTRCEVLDATSNALQTRIVLETAQVNHYFTKSYAEFQQKRARGRADVAEGQAERFRAEREFVDYDVNHVQDVTLHRSERSARA